jgi:hypothetical protein
MQGVSINLFECVLLLLLNRLPQSADVLGFRNFDREDLIRFVVFHNTIEIEA